MKKIKLLVFLICVVKLTGELSMFLSVSRSTRFCLICGVSLRFKIIMDNLRLYNIMNPSFSMSLYWLVWIIHTTVFWESKLYGHKYFIWTSNFNSHYSASSKLNSLEIFTLLLYSYNNIIFFILFNYTNICPILWVVYWIKEKMENM